VPYQILRTQAGIFKEEFVHGKPAALLYTTINIAQGKLVRMATWRCLWTKQWKCTCEPNNGSAPVQQLSL